MHGLTSVTVTGQGLQPVTIDCANWSKLIDAARSRGGPQLTVYDACCTYYNLCAPSVISTLSLALWNLWRRLEGTKQCSYEEYWNLPAIYVEGCDIIEAEVSVIQRRQQAEQNVVTRDLLKAGKRR